MFRRLIDLIFGTDNLVAFREEVHKITIQNKKLSKANVKPMEKVLSARKIRKRKQEQYKNIEHWLVLVGAVLNVVSFFVDVRIFTLTLPLYVSTLTIEISLRETAFDILSYKTLNPREPRKDLLFKEAWNKVISRKPIIIAAVCLVASIKKVFPGSYGIAMDFLSSQKL